MLLHRCTQLAITECCAHDRWVHRPSESDFYVRDVMERLEIAHHVADLRCRLGRSPCCGFGSGCLRPCGGLLSQIAIHCRAPHRTSSAWRRAGERAVAVVLILGQGGLRWVIRVLLLPMDG